MSIETFEFKPVRMHTPHDNLCAAIGLIQAEILAGDSNLIPESMFGNYHFHRSTLETAVAMLVAMVGETEHLRWHPEN